MGCNQSKIENEEAVARCKERKRYMKESVSNRNAFAAAHSSYATCLKNIGAALGDFAHGEVQNPQLNSSNDNTSNMNMNMNMNMNVPAPQPFEIPLPPPPLPDFPATPLQRAATMPEIKINKPMPDPVTTILEEDDDDEDDDNNEGSLRKRRVNRRVPLPQQEPPHPPMPPPPSSKQPEPRDQHVTHHHHSSVPPPDTQSVAWEYFFPSMENIAGTTLNAAEEEDPPPALHQIDRKLFEEKPTRVLHQDQVHVDLVTPVRMNVPVPEPEPEPEPHPNPNPKPDPVNVPEEMMETPVSIKMKQTPTSASVEGKRIVQRSFNLLQIFADLDDHFLQASEAAHEVSKMLRPRDCTITPILPIIEDTLITLHGSCELLHGIGL